MRVPYEEASQSNSTMISQDCGDATDGAFRASRLERSISGIATNGAPGLATRNKKPAIRKSNPMDTEVYIHETMEPEVNPPMDTLLY